LRESHSKESVARPEVSSLRRAADGRKLLPQSEVFQDYFPMAAECQRECAGDHDEQLQHASIVAGVGAKINGTTFGEPQHRGLKLHPPDYRTIAFGPTVAPENRVVTRRDRLDGLLREYRLVA